MPIDKTLLFLDPISPYSQDLCNKSNVHGAKLIFYQDDETVSRHIENADILITSTRKVPEELLHKAPRCRLVQKLGTGVNNIAISVATSKKIYVGNVEGANALAVAEYAVMLIMASCRHINIAHNKLVQENKWLKATLRDSCCEVSGKTVGIIGLGNIGRKVAALLRGFSCQILYYDPFRLDSEQERDLGVSYCALDALFGRADILTLHSPLTDQTRHMVNADRLALMKDSAVLINTGRGGLIDEAALYNTLKAGRLLGVALDTHAHEPMLPDNPLKEFERVIFSPHTAAGTRESMERVIGQAFENINSLLESGVIKNWSNIVNRQEWGR